MKQRLWVGSCLLGLVVGVASGANEPDAPDSEPPNLGGSALTLANPTHLSGTVYSRDANHQKELFKFTRVASRSGSTLKVQAEFTYPDGRLAVRERVVYEGDALVSYALEEFQIGAAGSASLQRSPENPDKGSIEFSYTRDAGGRAKTRSEGLAENTLIADMVGPFLSAHWAALGRGEKVKCRFIVVPHRQTIGFTFLKDSECSWRGREAIVLRMEPTSRLVATLVAPLFFTFEKAPPHRLLQYTGRTTPKIQAGGKWKDLDAVTVFDWDTASWANGLSARLQGQPSRAN